MAGADIGVTKRLRVLADLLSRHFFNAPQVSASQTVIAPVNSSPESNCGVGSYHAAVLALLTARNQQGGVAVRSSSLPYPQCWPHHAAIRVERQQEAKSFKRILSRV